MGRGVKNLEIICAPPWPKWKTGAIQRGVKLSGFAEINTGRLQLKIRSRATADIAVSNCNLFGFFIMQMRCLRADITELSRSRANFLVQRIVRRY